jgi:hypothetical protein
MAELDQPRPGHIVLRASHALADSDWNGGSYKLLFHSAAEVSDYLSYLPIGVVVIDRTNYPRPHLHQPLLEEAIASHPEIWQLAGVFPAKAAEQQGIAVYCRNGDLSPHRPIVLRATGTMQRIVTIDPSRPPW